MDARAAADSSPPVLPNLWSFQRSSTRRCPFRLRFERSLRSVASECRAQPLTRFWEVLLNSGMRFTDVVPRMGICPGRATSHSPC